MKVLSLKVDTSTLNLGEEEKKMTITDLVTRVINNVLYNYSQQTRGLIKVDRNMFYYLTKLFEKAVKENLESVELSDEECGFIRKCFRETRLSPSALLQEVEEIIDNLK